MLLGSVWSWESPSENGEHVTLRPLKVVGFHLSFQCLVGFIVKSPGFIWFHCEIARSNDFFQPKGVVQSPHDISARLLESHHDSSSLFLLKEVRSAGALANRKKSQQRNPFPIS